MRSAGILLPVTALPGGYGIGTLGAAARQFLDFLQAGGQRVDRLGLVSRRRIIAYNVKIRHGPLLCTIRYNISLFYHTYYKMKSPVIVSLDGGNDAH